MEEGRAKIGGRSGEADAASKLAIVRRSPFGDLPSASLSALLALGWFERLPRRHRLVGQGEPPKSLLLLGAGRVKLERHTATRTLPLGHRGPGQIVGETAVTGGHSATESALVVDPVEAMALPMAGFRKLLAADPSLRGAMTAALVSIHHAANARLTSLLLNGVEARLVDFLLDAGGRWGAAHPEGQLIAAPFTHADIATLIGSTRETVTLLLGKMKRAGLLGFERRRVIIRDRAALAQHVAARP
jgi:CRP/FNR family transcriptional regulator, cyclic AMP receptor protein